MPTAASNSPPKTSGARRRFFTVGASCPGIWGACSSRIGLTEAMGVPPSLHPRGHARDPGQRLESWLALSVSLAASSGVPTVDVRLYSNRPVAWGTVDRGGTADAGQASTNALGGALGRGRHRTEAPPARRRVRAEPSD